MTNLEGKVSKEPFSKDHPMYTMTILLSELKKEINKLKNMNNI